jgi:hypothetical protein
MELPEIAGEVVAFIVECSVYPQAIQIIQQIGLIGYFQELEKDPNFQTLARRLLANAAGNRGW